MGGESENMWWGYLHQNGQIQVKRWHGDHADYTTDCENNEFVIKVVRPFQADSYEEALSKIIEGVLTPKVSIKCETKSAIIKDGMQIAGSIYLRVLRVEKEDDGSYTAVTDHWPRPRGPVNMLESLKYWHDISDCTCSSGRAIGACLKCDMQAALDALGGNASAEYPPEREEIFLVSQTCQGGKWNKLVKSQELYWYSAKEAQDWLDKKESWVKEACKVFRVVIDLVEVEAV